MNWCFVWKTFCVIIERRKLRIISGPLLNDYRCNYNVRSTEKVNKPFFIEKLDVFYNNIISLCLKTKRKPWRISKPFLTDFSLSFTHRATVRAIKTIYQNIENLIYSHGKYVIVLKEDKRCFGSSWNIDQTIPRFILPIWRLYMQISPIIINQI